MYRESGPDKQKFSISVPRACYISDAFVNFSRHLSDAPAEIFYKETNSQRTIHNIINHDYKLGIIRYAENYEQYFKAMLAEKGLECETVTAFTYQLLMSKYSPLAQKEAITYGDLSSLIEIAHFQYWLNQLRQANISLNLFAAIW